MSLEKEESGGRWKRDVLSVVLSDATTPVGSVVLLREISFQIINI